MPLALQVVLDPLIQPIVVIAGGIKYAAMRESLRSATVDGVLLVATDSLGPRQWRRPTGLDGNRSLHDHDKRGIAKVLQQEAAHVCSSGAEADQGVQRQARFDVSVDQQRLLGRQPTGSRS